MSQKHYTGLTDAQVLESRQKHGANILTPPQKETIWDKIKESCCHWIALSMFGVVLISLIASFFLSGNMGDHIFSLPAIWLGATLLILTVGFFGGFSDPLFKILITAFVLSMGISSYEFFWNGAEPSIFLEPVGIIVALLLATGVAFWLERSNEKTFQSLNQVNDDTLVRVIRNNNVCQVARKEIVVEDIVILGAGEEIPADCELLESTNLIVNESSLTGEPQAFKSTNPEQFGGETTYAANQIMKGTIILEGNCTAIVQAVGDTTDCGKVFEAAQVDEGEATPLSEKLDELADWITKASYIFAGLIIVGRLIVYFVMNSVDFSGTEGWLDFVGYLLNTIMIAVTLIVVAVPEGLPMSVTLSLAFSMKKLMDEKTLPRTMHACETMGATSVICTDKTGTLTQNQMRVDHAEFLEKRMELIYEMVATNTTADLDYSDAQKIKPIGNPTEGALLLWLNEQGISYKDIREEVEKLSCLPFSTENKYMATKVSSNVLGKKALFVKGAPETIIALSDLSEEEKRQVTKQLLVCQNQAMRTLAMAYREVRDEEEVFFEGKLRSYDELHFIGFFAITDPVREEVPDAIQECVKAGIQVKIVTGDTAATAQEIGKKIGLWEEDDTERNIITGNEFASLSDEEIVERIQDIKILSRARPNDKERLVRLLKGQNHVVAVTGDGTNDAPALNAANVGLSMGDGTAVAKEASDMTIQDNSFSTITNAVMWGRSLYKNIQRFILFQMTINVAACLIVLIGAFIGTESPLTVTQMLWVNLIMDTFAAIALASLPPAQSVMQEKPRNVSDYIISNEMRERILGVGGLFTLLLLVIVVIMQHNEITSMADFLQLQWGAYNGLSDYELSLFFTLFVFLQFWNMFNAKAFMTGESAFAHLSRCKGFMAIAAVIFIGQIIIVTIGGKMFNVTPLALTDWIIITLLTSLVMIIGEVSRMMKKGATSNTRTHK